MGRILGIDYGTKRVGLATTDPLQLIVSGLGTIPEKELLSFLQNYLDSEEVEKIVIGKSYHPDGKQTSVSDAVDNLLKKLEKAFPDVKLDTHDEGFTSEQAKQVILQSGARRKKRRDKSLIDKVSAMLILEDYLGYN